MNSGAFLKVRAAASRVADLDPVSDRDLPTRGLRRPVRSLKWPWVTSCRAWRGGGETHAVHDVVEAHLEHAQQVLAGHALLARRIPEVVAELALDDRVAAPDLLLLAHLESVLAHLSASGGFIPGGVLRRSNEHFFE